MCSFKGQAIGEFCAKCLSCECHMTICFPIVVNAGVVCGECDDVDFCNYCPNYYECEELWGGIYK